MVVAQRSRAPVGVGPSTTRVVHGQVPDGRAYTTVSTILRILVDKGFAEAHPRGRSHVYGPLVSRADYQLRKLRSVLQGRFDGSAVDLVRQLVRSEELSPTELDQLRDFAPSGLCAERGVGPTA